MGQRMNLILGTRNDGWGRVRIILGSLALFVCTVPWIAFGYLDYREKPISEMAYVATCQDSRFIDSDARRFGFASPLDYCGDRFGLAQDAADKALWGGLFAVLA